MPDAFWVSDPFFVPYIDRETAVTVCRNQKMQIALPDLGEDFNIVGLNDGNEMNNHVDNDYFTVCSGAYLLTKKGITSHLNAESRWKNIHLKEFHLPERKLEQTYVLHQPPRELNAGEKLEISAQIISPEKPAEVEIIILKKGGGELVQMKPMDEYNYQAEISSGYTDKEQVLRYYINVKQGENYTLYPGSYNFV